MGETARDAAGPKRHVNRSKKNLSCGKIMNTLEDHFRRRRRQLIQAGLALGGLTAVMVAAGLAGRSSAAEAKVAKADVKYQFTPNGEARCGLCASFIPPTDTQGPGSCKAVQGLIPANGWCVLYAKP